MIVRWRGWKISFLSCIQSGWVGKFLALCGGGEGHLSTIVVLNMEASSNVAFFTWTAAWEKKTWPSIISLIDVGPFQIEETINHLLIHC